MGDYAALYTADSALPICDDWPETSLSLMVNRHLPILWLALFQPEDIGTVELEDYDEPWPFLASEMPRALDRLQARRAVLRAEFPGLRDDWIDQFAGYLSRAPHSHVHLDTNEIGGVVAESGAAWAAELREVLRMFETAEMTEPATGRKLYDLRFGGAGDEKRASCWWYCGGSGVDRFSPDD